MVIDSFKGKYRFLSNFAACSNMEPLYGVGVRTVEHAFQALKCAYEDDARKVLRAATPAIAKRRARKYQRVHNWNEIKVHVMRQALKQKFAPGTVMRFKLDATKGSTLIEGNTWGDRFWGMTQDDQGRWQGQNMLGRLLMEIRDGEV